MERNSSCIDCNEHCRDCSRILGNIDPHNIPQHEPGAKLDSQKPDASLLVDFGQALLAVATVGTYGCKKYARGSWQHVPDGVNRYTAALIRHLLQESFEEIDDDSGLPHAYHVAWNSLSRLELMLREQNKSGENQVDR